MDVLMSPDGIVRSWRDPEGTWDQHVPVFFSNPDLLWVSSIEFFRCSNAESRSHPG